MTSLLENYLVCIIGTQLVVFSIVQQTTQQQTQHSTKQPQQLATPIQVVVGEKVVLSEITSAGNIESAEVITRGNRVLVGGPKPKIFVFENQKLTLVASTDEVCCDCCVIVVLCGLLHYSAWHQTSEKLF